MEIYKGNETSTPSKKKPVIPQCPCFGSAYVLGDHMEEHERVVFSIVRGDDVVRRVIEGSDGAVRLGNSRDTSRVQNCMTKDP